MILSLWLQSSSNRKKKVADYLCVFICVLEKQTHRNWSFFIHVCRRRRRKTSMKVTCCGCLSELISTKCLIITIDLYWTWYESCNRYNFEDLSSKWRANCRFSAGLTGQFCEINIDDCEEKPCGVLSICKDALNGYNCFCAPGFIGK